MTIQMEAIEQRFVADPLVMLYKVVLTFEQTYCKVLFVLIFRLI